MKLHPAGLTLSLSLAASMGCGRTAIDRLGSAAGDDPAFADAGAEGDASVRDLGCDPTLRVESLTALPIRDAFATVIAGHGTVTYLETRPQGQLGRLERFDLVSGRQTRIAEGELSLIDATSNRSLFTRVENGQRQVMLENEGRVDSLFESGSDFHGSGMEPRRQIHGPLIAYCSGNGSSIHAEDLERGDRFGSLIQEGIPCQEPLYVDGRFIVHVGPPRNAENAIMLYRADFAAPLPIAMVWGANLAMPVLLLDHIYYLTDGRFSSQPIDYGLNAVVTTHSDLNCSAVHASGSGVVAACGVDSVGNPYATASELLFHDGRALRSLRAPKQDGRAVLLPRVGDGFVTWLAFDDPNALCNGSRGVPAGHVMAAALPDGPPTRVAPINAGCFCCGAIWPNPLLDAEGDTITWNYDASRASDQEPRAPAFGAARLVLGCE